MHVRLSTGLISSHSWIILLPEANSSNLFVFLYRTRSLYLGKRPRDCVRIRVGLQSLSQFACIFHDVVVCFVFACVPSKRKSILSRFIRYEMLCFLQVLALGRFLLAKVTKSCPMFWKINRWNFALREGFKSWLVELNLCGNYYQHNLVSDVRLFVWYCEFSIYLRPLEGNFQFNNCSVIFFHRNIPVRIHFRSGGLCNRRRYLYRVTRIMFFMCSLCQFFRFSRCSGNVKITSFMVTPFIDENNMLNF